jgi:4-coumarate--CoA ligase
MGGTVYWMPRFDLPLFLTYNARHRITLLFSVPPIYLLIAKSPAVTTQFASLEHAVSGAAPLGAALQSAASAKLGGPDCHISQTWGLSESTGSATLQPMDAPDTTGSVSALLPSMHARLVSPDPDADSDTPTDVPPGAPGEVLLRGPIVFRGYFRNASADAEAFTPRGGWFRTGDIGVFRDGLLYIVDRKKELIKYNGLQVAPAELEAVLLAHPRILDAAVIGVPMADDDGGEGGDGANEVPRAYVVVEPGTVGKAEVEKWVSGRVAGYKRLRGGVVFVREVPKSPAGKILRRELREGARREREGSARL